MNTEKLIRFMSKKGFTKEQIVKKSGIPRATFYRILKTGRISVDSLYKLVDALNMPGDLIIAIFFPDKR